MRGQMSTKTTINALTGPRAQAADEGERKAERNAGGDDERPRSDRPPPCL